MERSIPNMDRLTGLELLRFLSAFAVLVYHFQHFLFVGDSPAEYDVLRAPFQVPFRPVYFVGGYGVQLFWCISGFIFTWKYGPIVAARGISFRRFSLLRFSRLYPLHLVTLLIVAILNLWYFQRNGFWFVYQFNDLKHFLLNLAFASYWGLESGGSFNGPAWSVSVEIPIYLLFFAVCRVAGSNAAVDAVLAIGITAAVMMWRKTTGTMPPLLEAASFFYLGAVASRVHAWVMPLRNTPRRVLMLLGSAALALGVVLVHAKVIWIRSALFAFAPALLILFELAAVEAPAWAGRSFRWLGNLTYASYMVHFPLQLATALAFDLLGVRPIDLFYGGGFLLVYLAATFALSAATFRWFERPMQDAIRSMADTSASKRRHPPAA